jgi:PilZ domain
MITLDTEKEGIECRVRSVAGAVALLHRLSQLAPEVEARLKTGSACFLSFTHEGAPVGLRGITTPASTDFSELAFVVSDGVQVEERRVAERVPLVTRARVLELHSDGSTGQGVETFTADVSLGGTRVQRRAELAEAGRFRVELFFRGDRTPVLCEAELARATPTHLGLKFTAVDPDDRVRLAGFLAEFALRLRPVG